MRTKAPLLLIGLPLLLLAAVPSTGKTGTRVFSYEASLANPVTDASVISAENDAHMVAPPPRNRNAMANPIGKRKSLAAKFYRTVSSFSSQASQTSSSAPAFAVVPKPRNTPAQLLAVVDQPEINDAHKRMANEVLLTVLPERCRDTLKNFYVRYEKQKSRGLAGKDVMILDGTVPDSEFRALFIHESGHNIDLGCLQGTESAGRSAFTDGEDLIYQDDPSIGYYGISWITSHVQKSNARPEDFPSGYASYDAFEDFAEGFVYFVLQNEEFAKRAETNTAMAAKYAWFRDTLFGGIPHVANGKSEWKGKAPWDITKLVYEWIGGMRVARE